MRWIKKLFALLAAGGVIVFGVWSIVGYMSNRDVEEPPFMIETEASDYEIRYYSVQLRAEVVVEGNYREALYGGFRVLADYIFGNNTVSQNISMTAPVTAEASQKIPMTAPVLLAGAENRHVIAFIMPRIYSLESLPKPNNPDITLKKIEERRVVAVRFGGYATESRVNRKIRELKAALERDGIAMTGEAQVAQYNPPWTPPWMRRNEILIPVG